ncbi:MAG: histone deacetylase [Halobacteria archaeon]|nr:histone deacetylase [Halobacteria archaeon]
MTLGLVYDDDYLLHEHTPTHPERRERLAYTMDQLEEEGVFDLPEVELVEPSPASYEDLLRVHDEEYLESLRSMSDSGDGSLSPDTHVSEHTWDSARLSAGGVKLGGELVVDGDYDTSFVMSRPGGHHAFPDRGHGFCFINNTAVMVKYLQEAKDVGKVLIWDWDAHHFDGTQEIFYDDPSVLAVSTHQDGKTLFPGTGYAHEVGKGDGEGYTVNVPLPPKTGDDGYLRVVEEVFEPVAREFNPDLLFIEAGQDNHFTDPITDLGVTASGYASLMQKALDTAEEVCDGRVVASLSGGYGIEGGLPYTNLAVIGSLAGLDTSQIREPSIYDPPTESPDVSDVLEEVKDIQSEYWDL